MDPWVDPFSHRLRTDQMYTGLQIETSSGKVFETPPGDRENLGYERIQFRENAFEELAGMSWKYSLHNDYFGPLYRQKHLCLSNLRFPDHTEKLFWQEAQDWHTGTCHDLSAIHAVWSSSAYLVGLVFEYGGGKIRRQVGSTDLPGATTKSLQLAEGEKISKIEILRPAQNENVPMISFERKMRKNVDYFHFYFIEFHTSLGQKALFHYRIPTPEGTDDQQRVTHLEVCFTAYLFTGDGRYDPNRAVYPPESEIMGDQPRQGEQDRRVYAHYQFVGLGVTATEARPPPLFGSGIHQAAIDGIQTLKAEFSQHTRSRR
ncbi:hypothetical protein B0T20DRAFT_365978 [Sordaria brevicollis]|uniref:Uncharacterized protein n=1 Tax=Sordaria brevicollis TaxID=83679 RepID=A0AAE0NRI0_SORBR|nr:hypothetical protein B0T20DRAFT_365978 [Sordaria brevicollis]